MLGYSLARVGDVTGDGAPPGGAGLCNYLYTWDAFTPQAQFGPFASNRAPVLLYRP